MQLSDVIVRWRSFATKTNPCRDVIGNHHLHCATEDMMHMSGQSHAAFTCAVRRMKLTKAEGTMVPNSTVDPVERAKDKKTISSSIPYKWKDTTLFNHLVLALRFLIFEGTRKKAKSLTSQQINYLATQRHNWKSSCGVNKRLFCTVKQFAGLWYKRSFASADIDY